VVDMGDNAHVTKKLAGTISVCVPDVLLLVHNTTDLIDCEVHHVVYCVGTGGLLNKRQKKRK
jgi:hypothetical protein